jgi:hypothetical protein
MVFFSFGSSNGGHELGPRAHPSRTLSRAPVGPRQFAAASALRCPKRGVSIVTNFGNAQRDFHPILFAEKSEKGIYAI